MGPAFEFGAGLGAGLDPVLEFCTGAACGIGGCARGEGGTAIGAAVAAEAVVTVAGLGLITGAGLETLMAAAALEALGATGAGGLGG